MLNYVHFDSSDRQVVAGDSDLSGGGNILQARFAMDF